MIPYSSHYKSEDNILLLVLTAALKFLHLNIKNCRMGQNSFAFWLIPYCGNGIWCSHGLLVGKGAFVWKVGATLIRPPARPALRGEFLGGLSGLPEPLSSTYKHTQCVITVRAASALQVGFSLILHIDSHSSDCFQSNGKLIDLVCQVLDRNYSMTWNNIYLTAAVFQLLLSASLKLHFSSLFISMARVCEGLLRPTVRPITKRWRV